MARVSVLVAMPLIGRDAALVAGWAAAVDAVAAEFPEATFTRCAAIRAGDDEAACACLAAGVETVTVAWYDLPSGARHNFGGVALKRVRLVRAAADRGAAVVWFVDADIRPLPSHWAAADALFREGKPVVVVPYPVRWASGRRPVVCVATEAGLSLCDARSFEGLDGATSAIIAGGGMGCTAILTPVAALVRFSVASLALAEEPGGIMGEDIAWFLNARQAGVEVRMPLGLVAEHVGAEAEPITPAGAEADPH